MTLRCPGLSTPRSTTAGRPTLLQGGALRQSPFPKPGGYRQAAPNVAGNAA